MYISFSLINVWILYVCSFVWVTSNAGIVPHPTKSSTKAPNEKVVSYLLCDVTVLVLAVTAVTFLACELFKSIQLL